MLSPDRQEDLEAVFSYLFEDESEDFLNHVENEDYFVEEGILTKEDVDIFCNGNNDERYAIAEKAARNPKTKHIYANIFRLHEDFVSWREGERVHAFIYREKGICFKVELSDGSTASFPGTNSEALTMALVWANKRAKTLEIRED